MRDEELYYKAFLVPFNWRDGEGKLIKDRSMSLDNLYQFLKSRVDINAHGTDENETIIGITQDKGNIK